MRFNNLDRFRTGGSGNRMELSIPLPETPDGRIYRYSPNESAHPRHFVIGSRVRDVIATPEILARRRLEPGSKQTVCPYSGVVAEDDAFRHPDDIEAAKQIVAHAFRADVEERLSQVLKDFGRGLPRSGPVRVETQVNRTPKLSPRFYRKDLLRELVCDHCGRDYGVYAIALFCPDCGAPNVCLHFAREVELVEAQVKLAGEQSEELAFRLLGNAHEDVVTAFETTLKATFLYGFRRLHADGALPDVKNAFQNVARARKHFAALEVDPFGFLESADLATIRLNIQKRHVIGHNLGIVDENFAAQAADAQLGQSVHLVGDEVVAFASLAMRVIGSLDEWIGGHEVASPQLLEAETSADPQTPVQGAVESKLSKLRLSALAGRLAGFLVRQSEDGRNDLVREGAVLAEFKDVALDLLEEAIIELRMGGYIVARERMGPKLPRISYELELFATFDPIFLGTDPTKDAAQLGVLALGLGESVAVAKLREMVDWPLRRFNPAIAVLASHVGEGRVSRAYDPLYAVRHFSLIAEDRVRVKALIARTGCE